MELLLGHNQFLGISHISESKAREKEMRFSDVKNIYNIVETAYEIGYHGMIIETHPRMLEFLEYYSKSKTFDMDFYLQVPYAHGYIQRINENGIKDLLFCVLNQTGFFSASNMALKSIINSIKSDYISMAVDLLRFEIAPFTDINIKTLLLHNVITDMALSLNIGEALMSYENYAKDVLKIETGFITLNLPMLKTKFKNWDIAPTVVMTPVNPKGYDMNPSQTEVEQVIESFDTKIIAMNVFGGGAFSLKEVREYIKQRNNIRYCVIGASSSENLRQSYVALS